MKLTKLLFAHLMILSVLANCVNAQEKPPAGSEPTVVDEKPIQVSDIEKQFSTDLSGSVLAGYFTIDGAEDGNHLKEDQYRLGAVTKAKGDYWLFTYSHRGIPIPLMLKVLWAGKTPVLTLDDFTIAGMGTFSARVMFHGDRYAGTWQHGQKGGLMFGRIEKDQKRNQSAPKQPASDGTPPQNE